MPLSSSNMPPHFTPTSDEGLRGRSGENGMLQGKIPGRSDGRRSPIDRCQGGRCKPTRTLCGVPQERVPVDPGPWWAANEGQKVRGYHAQNFPDSPRCGRRRGRDADRASLQSNSMIFAALTTGKIAQVSFLATTPGRSSFLLDRESALKACPLQTDLTF